MTSPSPSPTTVQGRRSKTLRKEPLTFADLPSSLLEIILSLLVLKDNIRASAACKSWRAAAECVRVVEKHPWLLCFPSRGNSFNLIDPLKWKIHSMNLPELDKSTVCHSRDGWLLMHRSTSNDIFFLNSFSRQLISLPKFELPFMKMAFSCAPTMDNCVVLGLNFVVDKNHVTISTCRLGETEWVSEDFPTVYREGAANVKSQLVYANHRFYSFSAEGAWLYSFRPSSRKWSFHFQFDMHRLRWEWDDDIECFMGEKKGEIFLMCTSGNEEPVFYKLFYLRWKEMSITELDGLTFFASFHNSELRTDLPWMRNNVYFSRFGYNRKRCVSYSFDESRYNPCKEWKHWLELCPPRSLWIDPPENVLEYL